VSKAAVASLPTHLLEAVDELARQIAKTANKAYASHFRQVVKVLPPDLKDLHAWLASLDNPAIEELAERLRAVEGKPRPHFTAALKKARALALQERTLAEMPATFADALRWATERQGISVRELARRVEVSRATVRDWFKGKPPRSQARVRRIEEALDLPDGALLERLPRWGRQRLGAERRTGPYPGFSRTFLRVAALARYGKPWADLSPAEREALLREDRERWTRLSNRQKRARIAMRTPFRLPFASWPPQARAEWEAYEGYASSHPGSRERAERALRGEPLAPAPVRKTTLRKELASLEGFYGYCANVRGLGANDLGLALLTDLDLVRSYLWWRLERYREADVPPATRSELNFVALVKKFHRGYLRHLGLGVDPEGVRRLERQLKAAGLDATDGYHAVEPLLEDPEPLRWVVEGVRLMLRDAAGRVGDLLAPQIPASDRDAKEALALYRDTLLFWTMAAHPLRGRHFYEARVDMVEFRPDGDFAPGRGHVGRAGGGYYLAYRKREFKNARGQVFADLKDEDLVQFPLDDPEHPVLRLKVDGKEYSLGGLFHVYLREVLPRLAQALGRSGPLLPLFPGVDKLARLKLTFVNRSAYVAAVPGVPGKVLPFGPHSIRHIVATSVVKRTGSFEAAANVLLDSIDMVARHYARFAPRDRYRYGWQLFTRAGGGGW